MRILLHHVSATSINVSSSSSSSFYQIGIRIRLKSHVIFYKFLTLLRRNIKIGVPNRKSL